MASRIFAILLALAAVAGLVFASVSTLDFVQHLDRQVHDLHCSFAPGLVESDEASTGCQVTLLSPYSSIMRTSLWGGIPISLAAMAVFAFLAFRALEVVIAPAERRRTAAAIAVVSTLVPVGASAIMGYIAFTELHAACKLCIGIYVSSGVSLVMATVTWLLARNDDVAAERIEPIGHHHVGHHHVGHGTMLPSSVPTVPGDQRPAPTRAALAWLSAAGQAFAFVTIPVLSYALIVPDYSEYIGTCGVLIQPEDPYDVMVELGPQGGDALADGAVDAIEVFDPLCPACRAFEERMAASDLDVRLRRRAVMFPLDSECNWMVTRSLHPGACRVSEAVLCAASHDGVSADAVVQYAFEHQEALTKTGKTDPAQVTDDLAKQFPALAECLGSDVVESQINKSLRWAVANELPVMTPQLYVGPGVKLCDEDTDLGLDFTLHRMLELQTAGRLTASTPAGAGPDPDALVPGSEAGKGRDDAASESEPDPKKAKSKGSSNKPRSGKKKASFGHLPAPPGSGGGGAP